MTVFSSLKRSEADIRAMEQKKAELEVMPPIDFWHCPDTEEDDDKADSLYEKNKDLYVSVEVPFDFTDTSETPKTYTAKIKIFKHGTPEEFCAHRNMVTEVAKKLGYFHHEVTSAGIIIDERGNPLNSQAVRDKEASQLIPLAKSTLRGHASRVFEKYLSDNAISGENDTPTSPRHLYTHAWNQVALMVFQHPREAAKVQRRYLREGGLKFCGPYVEPRTFYERLDTINGYLAYFPLIHKSDGTYSKPAMLHPDDS